MTAGVIAEELGIEQVLVVPEALVPGVLAPSPDLQPTLVTRVDPTSVAVRAADDLVAMLGADVVRARTVARTAEVLHRIAVDALGWDPEDRWVLSLAARLHVIGVDRVGVAPLRHAAALVERAVLPGCTDRERWLASCLVRSLRGTLPGPGYAPFARLSPGDRGVAVRLLALLRLSEALCAPRFAAPVDLRVVSVGEDEVHLAVRGAEDVEHARWLATSRATLFERVTGRRLVIVVEEAGGRPRSGRVGPGHRIGAVAGPR